MGSFPIQNCYCTFPSLGLYLWVQGSFGHFLKIYPFQQIKAVGKLHFYILTQFCFHWCDRINNKDWPQNLVGCGGLVPKSLVKFGQGAEKILNIFLGMKPTILGRSEVGPIYWGGVNWAKKLTKSSAAASTNSDLWVYFDTYSIQIYFQSNGIRLPPFRSWWYEILKSTWCGGMLNKGT